MTHFTVEVRDPSTASLNRVLVVSAEARRVFSLFSAGGNPEPMSQVAQGLVDRLSLTTPDDLVGAEMTNSLSDLSVPAPHATFADALEAADKLLSEAQGGREPRPDVPDDIVFEVRTLASSVRQVQTEIRRELMRLERMHERLQSHLWRDVALPDRRDGAEPVKAEVKEQYKHILELLASPPEPVPTGRPIDGSSLTGRAKGALRKAGIVTLEQLEARSPEELAGLPGVGPSTLKEILALLRPQPTVNPKKRSASRRAPTTKTKATNSRRLTGRITAVKERFAFVKPNDGSADVFLHAGAVPAPGFSTLRVGQAVEFTPVAGTRGPRRRASDVVILE